MPLNWGITTVDNKWFRVYNTFMKSKIYITQRDNDRFFKQKLPTWRNGFCYIQRKVTLESDPHDVYPEGEYGYITIGKVKVTVIGSNHYGEFWIQ
jgi:hypothetical protein